MATQEGYDHIFHRVIRQKWRKISHGEGVYLFDTDGRRYLDACGGATLRTASVGCARRPIETRHGANPRGLAALKARTGRR